MPDFSPTDAAFEGFRFTKERPGAVAAWAGQRRVLMADLDPQRSSAEWRRMRTGPGPGLIESKPGALFVAQQAAERAGVDQGA
jgi:cellulose biosynthesis protein BcsQ